MTPLHSLVLLASDGHIRILENHGIGKGLAELAHLTRADLPDVDVTYRDRPPLDSGHGRAVHAAEPRQSQAEKERARMADHAIAELSRHWDSRSWDRLYVAAPDKMLAILRRSLPSRIAPHLAGDLDKDIVTLPLQELPDRFAGLVVF